MDSSLARALDIVLTDVAATGLPRPVIEDVDWPDLETQIGATLRSDFGQLGVSIVATDSEDAQLVSLADQIQEFVHEQVLHKAGLPVVWPECPLHPGSHPLQAVEDDLVGPAWQCARLGRTIARVGDLGRPGATGWV
jgi:hypothetical protein